MTARAAGWLAWSLWAVFAALLTLSLWLVWHGPAPADQSFGLLTLGFATVGALIASRRPDNAVGWLLLVMALAFDMQLLGDTYSYSPSLPGYAYVAWFAGWTWYVWLILGAAVLPLVFPDGRLLSQRWRPALWLAATALAANVVGAAFAPGRLGVEVAVQNPLGADGTAADVITAVARLADVLLVVAFGLAALSLVLRFRRARGVERQQLKWFAFAGLVTLGGLSLALVSVWFPGDGWRDVLGAVGWFSFLLASIIGIPVATGIAILRHRLYDIDVVINRTLVYGALTVTLLAMYLGSVLVLRLVLSPVTGESDLAVAGSTLTVAALVRPLRSRIQAIVDRRFYRARYDAEQTLEAFTGRLRHQIDLETLGSDLRTVVHDTVQPAHVSLWLRGGGR